MRKFLFDAQSTVIPEYHRFFVILQLDQQSFRNVRKSSLKNIRNFFRETFFTFGVGVKKSLSLLHNILLITWVFLHTITVSSDILKIKNTYLKLSFSFNSIIN